MKIRSFAFLLPVILLTGCTRTVTKVVTVATPTPRPTPVIKPTPTSTPTPREKRKIRAAARRVAAQKRRAEQRWLRIQRQKEKELEKAKLAREEEIRQAQVQAARLDGKVTQKEFDRIETGMSLSQVLDIIGPGEKVSESSIAGTYTVMYSWQNADGSNMNAIFQDFGLVSKAQFGLK